MNMKVKVKLNKKINKNCKLLLIVLFFGCFSVIVCMRILWVGVYGFYVVDFYIIWFFKSGKLLCYW